MVISTLVGGLGNQMFQYAAGRALALRTGSRLVLDLGWLRTTPAHVTPREFELGCFRIAAELRCIYPRTPLERVREWVGLSPRIWREHQMYGFDARTLTLPGRVRLIGYWPSERYFADAADRIRDDFYFDFDLDGRDLDVANLIAATQSVGVHVRHGDYATNPSTTAFHGVLPLDYYRRAVARVQETVPDPHFFVFSDDPEWCRHNLEFGAPTTVVDHNRGRGAHDLRLLSLCRHQVIANSSFSWWGAWLNETPDKLVIAPERWVADASIDTRAVYPESWIRL
jgi:hypothetical protein